MTSPTPSPDRLEELREQIARTIDPVAWDKALDAPWLSGPGACAARQKVAFARADAILALIRAQAERIAELESGGEAAAGDGRGAKR